MKRTPGSSYRLPYSSLLLLTVMLGCSTPQPPESRGPRFAPSEVIDLGALVTEDLPPVVFVY
jgi:hypothetical protein